MPRSRKEEKEIHIHNWRPGFDDSEEKCECGIIKVSMQEYERRRNVWEEYYLKVKGSPSYIRFVEMMTAIKSKNLGEVSKLKIECQKAIEERNFPVKKDRPRFPDPLIPRARYLVTTG